MTSPSWILYKRIRELEARVNLLEELLLDQFPAYSSRLGIDITQEDTGVILSDDEEYHSEDCVQCPATPEPIVIDNSDSDVSQEEGYDEFY